MGEVDCQSAISLGASMALIEAAFMDERINTPPKDQRPRCLRTETAADQERNETRGCAERASNCVWSTALDAFRVSVAGYVSGASAGVFHSRHPRQEYRQLSFGLPRAPAGGRVKGGLRAICGKFLTGPERACAP